MDEDHPGDGEVKEEHGVDGEHAPRVAHKASHEAHAGTRGPYESDANDNQAVDRIPPKQTQKGRNDERQNTIPEHTDRLDFNQLQHTCV